MELVRETTLFKSFSKNKKVRMNPRGISAKNDVMKVCIRKGKMCTSIMPTLEIVLR